MSAHRQHYTPQRPSFNTQRLEPRAVEHFPRRRHLRALLGHMLKALALAMAVGSSIIVLGFLAGLMAGQAHAGTVPAPQDEPSALLPTAIGLHIASHHFTPREQGTWNDRNPGVYARWGNGLVVGTLRNSERRQSVYVGHIWQTPRWHGVALDLTLGAINGYGRPVSPLAAVGASVAITPQATVRLSLLPKAAPKGSGAAHLSLEWSF